MLKLADVGGGGSLETAGSTDKNACKRANMQILALSQNARGSLR